MADYHRLALVNVAIEDNFKLRTSDIEFKLEKPSYTVTTLAYLKEQYPTHEFSLIMGGDNLRTFHKWYNYQEILDNHKVYVYPRQEGSLDSNNDILNHKNITVCENVPMMKISASYIRNAIKDGKDISYLVTPPVFKYIDEMNFYK